MNIQTSKRIMCCLLAVLFLGMCVMRPMVITANATGAEAGAMAGFVGIAPEVALPVILALLGVAYVGAHWDQICDFADTAISSLLVEIEDDMYIPGYEYDGKTYIEQPVIESVASAVLEYNEALFGDAWKLGSDFDKMYTISLSGNRDAVLWTSGSVQVVTGENYTDFVCSGDYVTYYAVKSGTNPYKEIFDSRTISAASDTAFSFANSIYNEYSVTTLAAVENPAVTYGGTIAVTNPLTDGEVLAIPVSPSTSVPSVKTDEEVIVVPTPDTLPGTGTADFSGILSWLRAIWDAIKALAGSISIPIVEAVTAVKTVITNATNGIIQSLMNAAAGVRNAINTGITTITDTITTTIDAIIEWLISIGASLSDILEWIIALPGLIADAIGAVIADVFVPSEDFISDKFNSVKSKFAWIGPFIDIAQGFMYDLSSSTPPVVYVHLGDSESKYNYGGTVKFLDMSWYEPYKPTGDAILSGFLWGLFAWRIYLKLPGIINGVSGSIGHMSSSAGRYRKEDGE